MNLDLNIGPKKNVRLFIWRNGLLKEDSLFIFFEFHLYEKYKIEKLKNTIKEKLMGLCDQDSLHYIRIFDYKGFEMDDEQDINDIKINETIYCSTNGKLLIPY